MSLEQEVAGLDFIDKLNHVIGNGILDYWVDRGDPPNLDRKNFLQVMDRVFSALDLRWDKRKSLDGPYGLTGEDDCFYFDCEASFGGVHGVIEKRYFVKGYFFDKGNLKGVTIQSFREV